MSQTFEKFLEIIIANEKDFIEQDKKYAEEAGKVPTTWDRYPESDWKQIFDLGEVVAIEHFIFKHPTTGEDAYAETRKMVVQGFADFMVDDIKRLRDKVSEGETVRFYIYGALIGRGIIYSPNSWDRGDGGYLRMNRIKVNKSDA